MPDLAGEDELDFAGFEIVDKIISAHMRGEPFASIPQFAPYMPLDYAKDRLVKHRDLAQLRKAPPEILDRFAALIGFVLAIPATVGTAPPPQTPPAEVTPPAPPAMAPALPPPMGGLPS